VTAELKLTGQLLVAAPGLKDSPFEWTVVLVLSHDEDGALGVVVNRPTEVEVGEVLPSWKSVVSPPGNVFQGGPVGLDSALGVVSFDTGDEPIGIRRVSGTVGVVDLDTPPEVVGTAIVAMRVFAGYAGWSPGQVEDEITEGSWYVVDAEASDAFVPDTDDLWSVVLRRQTGPLALLASFPADPTMN